MARTYKRDSKGRFASGGGGSGTPRARAAVARTMPRTTSARGRARTAETRARAALRAGGGAKAARSLATAQRARDWYRATGGGTKRSTTRPRSGIRRTGGLKRPAPASGIRPTTKGRRPLALRANNVRPYRPATMNGAFDRTDRRVDKSLKEMTDAVSGIGKLRRESREYKRWKARQQARALADRSKGGIDKELADITLKHFGWRLGAQQIKHRARRAARRAAAGSKVAARALKIYDQQLAFTGTGKPSRRAKNAIKPGPRNANPPKKPPRKPRKRKPKG